MKIQRKEWLIALVIGVLMPSLMFRVVEKLIVRERPTLPSGEMTEVTEQGGQTQTKPSEVKNILIQMADGTVKEMNMDTYIVGVVLGEMPTDFETEALKAQAVVARTYAWKQSTMGNKHASGVVCTDAACCQAYRHPADYLAAGGTQSGLNKVMSAVAETAGQVLTYHGVLIEATYFSCSGGTTEDAAAVWGTEFPYLISVSSPGEEKAAWYEDTVAFSPKGFQEALGQEFSGSPESWFGLTEYTKGGGVKSMFISGQPFTGIQLRSLLNLRSTAFWAEVKNGQILIHTKGYGHRVGMSQYGADAMAVGGSSWQEILAHYYPGTTPKRLILDENGELVYDQ